MNDFPRVTVVTPSFNQGNFIAQTIESVLAQTYPNLEYIIMDGGSTDDTLSIIERYASDARLTCISEADNGQTHAINKGIARSSGSILTWLNSDDIFIGQPLQDYAEIFEKYPGVVVVYGQVMMIDAAGKPVENALMGEAFDVVRTLSDVRTTIPQAGAFFRRALWEQIGGLREDLHYSMDTDLWIRASRHGTLYFMPKVTAGYRRHVAAKTVGQAVESWKENTELAESFLREPELYPDLVEKRRLIHSNLAWGTASAYAQQGDTQQARIYAWKALRKSPLRLRQVAMVMHIIDWNLRTDFSGKLLRLWQVAKRYIRPPTHES